ncbi:sensor histidine kinase [Paenibacillus sp. sptzw28]|uniref:sensor histidine kinase n=1 Tax=Paenibacillus sp. sptzw28 TaxID=715179 RepID=UPI001C6EFC2E|nr:sensor histidine kinase [Paenibacillus sp. sptzw28]QYR21083.1 sensor histidine kinase [Paenibacillus sp. sptzw28]
MNGIQKKILTLSGIVLFIMAAIWAIMTYYNQRTQDQYNLILQRYLHMNEITSSSQQLVSRLNDYLLEPSTEKLSNLSGSEERLLAAQRQISGLRNKSNDFTLTNYIHLVDSLIDSTNRSVMFAKEKNSEQSLDYFTEADRFSQYISETTLTLMGKEMNTYDRFYRGIMEQSAELKKLGVWMFALISLMLFLFAYWFSLSITRPIQKLTAAARELSRGRFDLHIEVTSKDEISFLARTFDRMRININGLISEIQQKAQLEGELQRNKLLLQESRLLSLQRQINPHFLFNTLDTLSKKAYLEGAAETSDLLVNVAGILRYNLKRLDRSVTLYDEVKVLTQYIEIQNARFADRLQFLQEIDESCLYVQLPGLTLQPIVENAVIHAVEPLEDGGAITLRIREAGAQVIVEIEDNGAGMAEEKVREILDERVAETEGRSTGIGFSNVVRRLRLFYAEEDVLDIESRPGQGTKVILKLPKVRRIEGYDEAADRG